MKSLTSDSVYKILDPHIKQIILDRILTFNSNFPDDQKILSGTFVAPLYLIGKKGHQTEIKSVRLFEPASNMVNIKNGINTWAKTGNNHHIEIYVSGDGKIHGDVITLYETSVRRQSNKQIIDKERKNDEEFICSFQENEMVIMGGIVDGFDPEDKNTYFLISKNVYRVQNMEVGTNIVFRLHYNTSSDNDGEPLKINSKPQPLIKKRKVIKITVDPLGFISLEARR